MRKEVLVVLFAALLIFSSSFISAGVVENMGDWFSSFFNGGKEVYFAPKSSISTVSAPKVLDKFGNTLITETKLSSFSVPKDTKIESVKINKIFDSSAEIPFSYNSISSILFSGKVKVSSKKGYARVIAVDENSNEYLIFGSDFLVLDDESSLENVCEETCNLDGVNVESLRVEIKDASLELNDLGLLRRDSADYSRLSSRETYKSKQEETQVDLWNSKIQQRELYWAAGKTSVSGLSYSEKKGLFGNELPNLHGFEYYSGGIFEIPSNAPSGKQNENGAGLRDDSNLPEEWDWRSAHGESWVTSVKNQLTCGSCVVFGTIGALETVANLYYNQHLDLDLSEQEIISCSSGLGGSCDIGWHPNDVLTYIENFGIVDENCFPYSATDNSCSNKCLSPTSKIKSSGRRFIPNLESEIKSAIVNKGGLVATVYSWNHAMNLIGYGTIRAGYFVYDGSSSNQDWIIIEEGDPLIGQTYWIFKNSWGPNFGNDGFSYIVVDNINDLGMAYSIDLPIVSEIGNYDILCVDKDSDNYCNWGISEEKPLNCPASCGAEKDCDDSDSTVTSCEDYSFYEHCSDNDVTGDIFKRGFIRYADEKQYDRCNPYPNEGSVFGSPVTYELSCSSSNPSGWAWEMKWCPNGYRCYDKSTGSIEFDQEGICTKCYDTDIYDSSLISGVVYRPGLPDLNDLCDAGNGGTLEFSCVDPLNSNDVTYKVDACMEGRVCQDGRCVEVTSPDECQDSCESSNFECGIHNFCGVDQYCGACSGTGVCQNGLCTEFDCYDSDNGQNPDVKGYTTYNWGNLKEDFCDATVQTRVLEGYCFENEQRSISLDCPAGKICQEGQCVTPQQPTCFDSDNGLDKFTKGFVQIGYGSEVMEWDSCSQGFINTVEERYCSTDTMIGMLTQYCGEGFICEDGKCVAGGDECITGQIQCIGQPGPDYYKKCMDCDGDGASEWCYRPNEGGESFRCGYENGVYVDDEVCQNGQCISFGESCAGFGYECGTQSLCGANINCGTCESGESCISGECVSSGGESCQSLGIECGVHNVNGNTKNCGACEDCNECTLNFCNYVHDGEATCEPRNLEEGTPCTTCSGDNCVCSAGQCVDADNCINECNLGQDTCSDSRVLKVCGNYDYDSCYEYNLGGIGAGNVLCPFGEECSNGACVPCLKTCASEGFTCGTHNFCNAYVDCGTCTQEGTACSSGSCVDCTNWDCNTKGFTCGTHNICGEIFDCGTCGEGMNCGQTEFCLTAGTGACVCVNVNVNHGGIPYCKKGDTITQVQGKCLPLPQTPPTTPTPNGEEAEVGLSPEVNYEGPLMKLFKWIFGE